MPAFVRAFFFGASMKLIVCFLLLAWAVSAPLVLVVSLLVRPMRDHWLLFGLGLMILLGCGGSDGARRKLWWL